MAQGAYADRTHIGVSRWSLSPQAFHILVAPQPFLLRFPSQAWKPLQLSGEQPGKLQVECPGHGTPCTMPPAAGRLRGPSLSSPCRAWPTHARKPLD